MDPLSITASIIAVASLAAKTGRAFGELRNLCKTLPGRLHALSNEVADIELVLYQVATVYKSREAEPSLQDENAEIWYLLEEAQKKLEELRAIIVRLTSICERTKAPVLGAISWRKDQQKLQALQDEIKGIKCSLNIMLGASNS